MRLRFRALLQGAFAGGMAYVSQITPFGHVAGFMCAGCAGVLFVGALLSAGDAICGERDGLG